MQNWIENYHNLTSQKNQNGNIELNKEDVKTLQILCNAVHEQARLEQFHSPELQAVIAYIENLYFMK